MKEEGCNGRIVVAYLFKGVTSRSKIYPNDRKLHIIMNSRLLNVPLPSPFPSKVSFPEPFVHSPEPSEAVAAWNDAGDVSV